MIPNPIQRGYLLLADISGSTPSLAQTELEHSLDVLSELLETIIKRFKPLGTHPTHFRMLFKLRTPFLLEWIEKPLCRLILRFQMFRLWKLEPFDGLMLISPEAK